ncbi:N-acetyltransferase [Lysobacter sp. TY2-98]|uniref:GNAT family N-acetyltransferase n=1 Tax=Lysobacter sp. TY2-98 TaxID=2290922 RepID=UPI000E1FB777|nr:GNAT family N-acetyltransferase [Lysobacter sp. TY2-98]AXK72717.1 N-acetyltransferase [Lysobacter sp. TY2-98]
MSDGFVVRTDREAVDVDLVHHWLSTESYWAAGIPRDTVARAIANSLCFTGLLDGRQVAFARVISDFATFAYLADVFVLDEVRGRGYATQLMDAVFVHSDLQGLRRFMLATRDAHALYARYDFTSPAKPASLMERYAPDIYRSA